MKFLLINSLPIHHEMFGYIIEYCQQFNHKLDIFTAPSDMGIKKWYDEFFNASFNYVTTINFDKINSDYDKIFLTTDDDLNNYVKSIDDINHFGYNNIICINHAFVMRNFKCINHITTRYFKKINCEYVYPCYDVISYDDKIALLKEEININIFMCAVPENINQINVYDNLLSKNKNIHIFHISRQIANIDLIKEKYGTKIALFEDLEYSMMEQILKKCHYVYFPNYTNNNYLHNLTSGCIQLAFNYACQILFPLEGYKDAYKLNSPIEDMNGLILTNSPDVKGVIKEREILINHRNKVFNNTIFNRPIIKNTPIINHKIPKKIYQTWETKNLKPCLNTLIEQVKTQNKNYEHYLFDKNDQRDFIKDNFQPLILQVYDRIIPGGFKADLWRYCILYTYGGIYCDIDMICHNSFDLVIKDNVELFMPIDPKEGTHNLLNSFIGVVPNHPVMKNCIDIIVDNVTNNTWWDGDKLPLEFSGPGVLGKALNNFLKRDPRDSFVGMEGLINKNINLLKFTNENESGNYTPVILNEFMKTSNNDYIFQNINGNVFLKRQYNDEIKQYNIISGSDCIHKNIKPYTECDVTII